MEIKIDKSFEINLSKSEITEILKDYIHNKEGLSVEQVYFKLEKDYEEGYEPLHYFSSATLTGKLKE